MAIIRLEVLVFVLAAQDLITREAREPGVEPGTTFLTYTLIQWRLDQWEHELRMPL